MDKAYLIKDICIIMLFILNTIMYVCNSKRDRMYNTTVSQNFYLVKENSRLKKELEDLKNERNS